MLVLVLSIIRLMGFEASNDTSDVFPELFVLLCLLFLEPDDECVGWTGRVGCGYGAGFLLFLGIGSLLCGSVA